MALLNFNSSSYLVLLGVFIATLVGKWWTRPQILRHGQKLRCPPNTLPILGNAIIFLRPRKALFQYFTKATLLHPYETLSISVPTLPPGVFISSPQNLDFIFKHEAVFSKGDFVKTRSWDLFGHGIINVDGEMWKVQRKAGLRFLSAANLKVYMDVALPKYMEKSVEFLNESAAGGEREGQAVDLQGAIHDISTRLMGRMAYNMDMHAGDEFTSAFEYASGATAERFQNPLWFITEVVMGRKLQKSIATIKEYGRRIVANAVADKKRKEEKKSSSNTWTTQQLQTSDVEEETGHVSGSLIQSLLESIGDQHVVADAALNYLSAGRDTVAQALTWTFYLLMKHSSIITNLIAEIQKLESRGGSADSSPYALAIFLESLRLYPPIPIEIKQTQAATTLPDGTYLPANSVVLWCPWAMNRCRKTWGPDADEFKPERWLDVDEEGSSSTVVQRSAADFPVFNGGARLCLGKTMAETMGVKVLVRLAKEFEFLPAFDQGVERTSGSSLTLPMEGGLPVYVKRRAL